MEDRYMCKLCQEMVDGHDRMKHFVDCRGIIKEIEDSFILECEVIDNRYGVCAACGEPVSVGGSMRWAIYQTSSKAGISLVIRTYYHPRCFPKGLEK